MGVFLGRGLAFGFGAQSDLTTPASATVWVRGVSCTVQRSVKYVARPTLSHPGNGPLVGSHYAASDDVSGQIKFLAGYEGMGLILKHVLGAASTGSPSGGIYTHTYTLAADVPTYPLTIDVIQGTGGGEVYSGCRITKMTLAITAGGLMEVTCDIIGRTSAGRTSASSPTFTTNELDVLHYQAGSMGWNSGTYTPESFTLTIDRTLGTRYVLGSLYTADPKPGNFGTVEAQIVQAWESNAMHTGMIGGTSSDLTLSFSGSGSRTFGITMHNALVTACSDPISAVGVVKQNATLAARPDGTDLGLAIAIANTQSSADAA